MPAPKLEIQVEPVEGGNAVYLPIAPSTATGAAMYKVVLRLRIKNTGKSTVRVNGITFSFPGSTHPSTVMQGVNMTGSLDLAAGAAEFWSNGIVDLDPDPDVKNNVNNAIYLSGTPPTQVRIAVTCKDFTTAVTVTMALAAHKSPVTDDAYRFPYAAGELRADEYYQTDAVHWANGGAPGTQIYAHDIGCVGWDSAKKKWSSLVPGGSDKKNEDYRIYDKPVRAVAEGAIDDWHDGMADNSVVGSFPDPSPDPKSGNFVLIKHGTESVKYCHLRNGSIPEALKKKGVKVAEGQMLGRVGNTGNSTNPHTHLEARRASDGALRPMPFRSGFVVDKAKLKPPANAGPWFRLRGHGISKEAVAVWPASTSPGSPVPTVGIKMGGTWANSFWTSPDLESFTKTAQHLFDDKGRRLMRATTYLDGGKRRWAGIARAGNWASRFWVSNTLASFKQTAQELFDDKGLRLEHMHTFLDGTKRKWAGIARGGTWGSRLIIKSDLASFSKEAQTLFDDQGLRLVNITTWLQAGKRNWFGIARSGDWANTWWISPTYDHFRNKTQALFDNDGMRISHVTSYMDGSARKWIGISRSGDWANRLILRSDLDQFALETQRLFDEDKLRLVHVDMLE